MWLILFFPLLLAFGHITLPTFDQLVFATARRGGTRFGNLIVWLVRITLCRVMCITHTMLVSQALTPKRPRDPFIPRCDMITSEPQDVDPICWRSAMKIDRLVTSQPNRRFRTKP